MSKPKIVNYIFILFLLIMILPNSSFADNSLSTKEKSTINSEVLKELSKEKLCYLSNQYGNYDLFVVNGEGCTFRQINPVSEMYIVNYKESEIYSLTSTDDVNNISPVWSPIIAE